MSRDIPISAYTRYLTKDISFHQPLASQCTCSNHYPPFIWRWKSLASKLTEAGTEFLIEPYIRFEGQPGEQATMFFMDPSGNPLEFKAFQNVKRQLFETRILRSQLWQIQSNKS